MIYRSKVGQEEPAGPGREKLGDEWGGMKSLCSANQGRPQAGRAAAATDAS